MVEDTTPEENLPIEETKLIDQAVQYINDSIGSAYYETAILVGKYVLEKFFKDNLKEVKSMSPKKEHSFNKLCQRSDLQVHPKHLYQMTVVAAQEKILVEKLREKGAGKLGYSLKVELLKINSDKKKIEFAKHFIKNSFTVIQAREYLKLQIGTDSTLDIIPFSKPLIDQFSKISEWAEKEELAVEFGELTPHKIKTINGNIQTFLKYIENIDQVKNKLMNVEKQLSARVSQKKESIVKDPTQKNKDK